MEDTTNDTPVLRFWRNARSLLLNFRAGAFDGNVEALHTELLSEAQGIDPNRRTSPYNPKSIYQDEMNLIIGQTLKLAQKWLNDGKPPVPAN